ncbi:MAG: hypothetical protein ACXADH_19000 [Candidatus Kariarchaeaceae archaeon]|jgi:hypothetical protein
MSEIRVNRLSNELNTGGPTLSGITTFSGQQYFVPPSGSTAERPSDCPPGSIRFNTDSAHLEYWDGLQWLEFESEESAPLGTRGLFAGGGTPNVNVIQYVTISTTGNSIDFGDLIRAQRHTGGNIASVTRGVFGGGYAEPNGGTNVMEYVTIATLGNSIDFGDRAGGSTWSWGGLSNSTRGLWFGSSSPSNTIDFITISSTGNSQDFGDHLISSRDICGLASPTRGILGGDNTTSNVIGYVTIASTGNSVDFGDLSFNTPSGNQYGRATGSNGTRGIFGPHGESPVGKYQYITISTTGNSQDFGDALVSNKYATGTSSPLRMIGTGANPAANDVDFVTIATTGNAQNFGDLTTTAAACSNGHGGL